MKKIIILFITAPIFLLSNISNKEIANIFIIGFNGDNVQKVGLCNRGLGGVIIFKKSPTGKSYKNFYDKSTLKKLTKNLKNCIDRPLIAVDQEGGLVQRVNFGTKYPKASIVAKKGLLYAKKVYSKMAQELSSVGINLNFAPVADLAINPKNRVIVRFGRSYGAKARNVIPYNGAFIDSMHNYGIATSLKHFPGHGSSFGDTHKGFVDVTSLWKSKELEPYRALKNSTDTVMVAHIFHRSYDKKYPASLSRNIVTRLLKNKIGFSGVVVTDDLQMGAIKKHYSLKDTIALAINAGDDMLLFANQLSPRGSVSIDKLVKITRELINEGRVKESTIKRANSRINRLKNRLY